MYQLETSSTNDVEGPGDVDGQRRLVALGRLCDELLRPLDEPPVDRSQLDVRLEPVPRRREALDVAVVDEELHRVPERQQLALDLVRRAEAEEEVAVWRLRAVLPAHHVGAHLVEGILGGDRVPPRGVHLAPLLVEHLLVGQHPRYGEWPTRATDMKNCE